MIEVLELNGINPISEQFINFWVNLHTKKQNTHDYPSISIEDVTDLRKKHELLHLWVPLSSGKKIEVLIFGKGKPLLLIPGLGVISPIWINQLEELSLDFQLIMIHKPGHGLSEVTDDLSYPGICKVLYEILNTLRIFEPIYLVGTCIGGLIALTFAALFPDTIASLALVNTILTWDSNAFDKGPMNREKVKAIMSFLNAFDSKLKKDFNAITPQLQKQNQLKVFLVTKYNLQVQSKSIDPYAYIRYFVDISSGDGVNSIIPKIDCPTLLLTGNKDSVVSNDDSRMLNEMVKRSEYYELSDAGHFPYISHPKKFNDKIKSFFK